MFTPTKLQEFTLEVVGTMVLILFGAGSVAMLVLFGGNNGTFLSVNFAWGFAVMFGVLASQPSGAHLNPAVTLALAVTKRFPWAKVWYYMVAQLIGAFIGAGLVYLVFYGKFMEMQSTLSASYTGIFATFPAVEGYGYFDQIVGTTLLVFGILTIGSARPKLASLEFFFVGLLVVAIGISFGGMHGYTINPARDLGPRLLALVAGFSGNGFDNPLIWFVQPIVMPLIGGVVGAWIFDLTRGKVKEEASN